MDAAAVASHRNARAPGFGLAALRAAAWTLFWVFTGVLVAGGLSGLLAPLWAPWERFVQLDPFATLLSAPMAPEAAASALNQWRYLKGMEAALGILLWVFRREVFSSRRLNLAFVALVSVGALSRLLSVVVDGVPYPAFFAFMAVEAATAAAVFAYGRTTVTRA